MNLLFLVQRWRPFKFSPLLLLQSLLPTRPPVCHPRLVSQVRSFQTVQKSSVHFFHHAAPHPSGHRTLLPVGPAYINHLRLSLHHSHSFSSLDKHLAVERERLAALHGEDNAGEDDLGVGEEEESEELLALDPKEWKVFPFVMPRSYFFF